MRRLPQDGPPPAYALEACLDRMREILRRQEGLRLMLAGMPPGSTLEDARRLHRGLKQAGRTPCRFLDASSGSNVIDEAFVQRFEGAGWVSSLGERVAELPEPVRAAFRALERDLAQE